MESVVGMESVGLLSIGIYINGGKGTIDIKQIGKENYKHIENSCSFVSLISDTFEVFLFGNFVLWPVEN